MNVMKLIIAGSRSITDSDTVENAFDESQFTWDSVNVLINGDADGVDSIAKDLVTRKDHIQVEEYPADDFLDDDVPQRVAPLLRNTKMAEEADALLAVWDGESTGTEDMIKKARKENLQIEIHRTDTKSLSDF